MQERSALLNYWFTQLGGLRQPQWSWNHIICTQSATPFCPLRIVWKNL